MHCFAHTQRTQFGTEFLIGKRPETPLFVERCVPRDVVERRQGDRFEPQCSGPFNDVFEQSGAEAPPPVRGEDAQLFDVGKSVNKVDEHVADRNVIGDDRRSTQGYVADQGRDRCGFVSRDLGQPDLDEHSSGGAFDFL